MFNSLLQLSLSLNARFHSMRGKYETSKNNQVGYDVILDAAGYCRYDVISVAAER